VPLGNAEIRREGSKIAGMREAEEVETRMDKQLSFGPAEYLGKKKVTGQQAFLEEMEAARASER
jgi:hypothetical protein